MLRPALAAIAIAAAVAFVRAGASTAIAQAIEAPVAFNQTLLDRALVVIPAINRYATSSDAPQTEAAAQARLEQVCTEAGFETQDQCTNTIGYVGIMIGGFDPATRTFKDPIARMRARIAEIEANPQLPAATKEQMTAPIKEAVAGFRHIIPAAHLQLMTANGRHIFKTLATQGKK